MGKPALTTEEWIAKAKQYHGDKYDYSRSVYVKYGFPLIIGCPEHGWFEQRENNHRNGAGCPICGLDSRKEKRTHSFERFLEKARNIHGDAYSYRFDNFVNSRSVITITCHEHGEFEQKAYSHLNGQGCKLCGYEKIGKQSQIGISEFLKRAKSVHGDTYEYLSGLSSLHKNIKINCKLHGVFKQTPHNHLKGAGCPRCANRVSKGEAELADFIKSLGVSCEFNLRNVIKPYELDIYVESHKIAFEYHGLWFHREDVDRGKTRKKWELCAKEGIKLIQIFEDEWFFNNTIVRERIRALLGKSAAIGARKCSIKELDSKVAGAFLNRYHLQGAGPNLRKAYGLLHQNEIVAVATFAKGRFNNEGWEMLRYASKGRVIGGISRLVKFFSKNNEVSSVVSYSDLRWGDGESYGRAGFVLDKVTDPDYWWVDLKSNKRVSRYKVQPKKTGIPEKEYATLHNMPRILGVGHKRWLWTP